MTRPRILISTSNAHRPVGLRRMDALTGLNYNQAVLQAGGLPLMVATLEPSLADAFLEGADGLLLTGGVDVDPDYFGEEPHPMLGLVDLARDRFEMALYRAARRRGIPVLGICRGHQLINVVEGGSLHQHVPALGHTVQHEQMDIDGGPAHSVRLEHGSVIARAFGHERVRTNSFHHQAVDRPGHGLRVTGRTADGIAEVIENTGGSFVLGVQWHPEMSFQAFPEQAAPFEAFMAAVRNAELVHA